MSLTAKIETPSITYEQPLGLYIDGQWVKGKEGKTFETINPTNEKPIIAVHEAGPDGKLHLSIPPYDLLANSHRCRYCRKGCPKGLQWRLGRDPPIRQRSDAFQAR